MDPVTENLVGHLTIAEGLFVKALEGLSPEEVHRRAGPDSSSMIWVAGHLVLTRWGMLKMIGVEMERPWGDLFGRGSLARPPAEYPPLGEIIGWWQKLAGRLKEELQRVPEDVLAAEAPRTFPVPDRSIRAGLAFLVWHEAYHIGQMGFIRRMLGHSGLVG